MPAMMSWPVSSLVKRGTSGLPRPGVASPRHLVVVGLGLRLDRHGNDRFGESRRFQRHVNSFVAKRVARGDVPQPDQGGDVARVAWSMSASLSAWMNQTRRHARVCGCADCKSCRPFDPSGIDAKEDELADERVGPELERQRAELAVVIGTASTFNPCHPGPGLRAGGTSSGLGR